MRLDFGRDGDGSTFHRVLWDDADTRLGGMKPTKNITRCFVFGQSLFDLLEAREEAGIDDVSVIRLEQLYPVPENPLMAELETLAHAEMVWCQEEPRNMGAQSHVEPELEDTLIIWVQTHVRPMPGGVPPPLRTGLMSRHCKGAPNCWPMR